MNSNRGLKWHIAVILSTLLFTSQASAAYFSTLSVSGKSPERGMLLVAEADEADDLEAAEAEETDELEAAEAAEGESEESDEESEEEESSRYDEMDLDANEWAFWGGLAGHTLWFTSFIMGIAIGDPSGGSAAAVWGLHSASTIVGTMAANSAIDNVGVFGGPGQKMGSWLFFGLGIITFAVVEVLIAVEDPVNNAVNTVNTATGGPAADDGVDFSTGGMVTVFTLPSLASAALMSSVAMRSHRQVRRAKRKTGYEEALLPQEKSPVQVGFNVLPNLTRDYDGSTSANGMMGKLTLRF